MPLWYTTSICPDQSHLQDFEQCKFLDPTPKTPTVQKSTREALVGAVIKQPLKGLIYLPLLPLTLAYEEYLSVAVLGSPAGQCFLISISVSKMNLSC